MGGGVNLFFKGKNLVALAASLSILILFTLVLEFILHRLSHIAQNHPAGTATFQKAVTELMIMGFISFITLMTIQFDQNHNSTIIAYIAEFELAHIWLFFVGIMYVVHVVGFGIYFRYVKRNWDRMNLLSLRDIVDKFKTEDGAWSKKRRGWLRQLLCGSGTSAYAEAQFKVFRLLFLQQNWRRLLTEMGSTQNVESFDYSQYMRTLVTKELTDSLEVHPLTWTIFLVFFWVYLAISAVIDGGGTHSNNVGISGMVAGWAMLLVMWALVLDQNVALRRLQTSVVEGFKGVTGKQGNELEDIFEEMVTKGLLVQEEVVPVNLANPIRVPEKRIRRYSRRPSQSQSRTSRRGSLAPAKHTRVQAFQRVDMSNVRGCLKLKPSTMQRVSGLIIFAQSFVLGLELMLNSLELDNDFLYFGTIIPPDGLDLHGRDDHGTSLYSAGDNHTQGHADGPVAAVGPDAGPADGEHRRVLLAGAEKVAGPNYVTPIWAKCAALGPERAPASFVFSYDNVFVGHAPYSNQGEVIGCTVYGEWVFLFGMIFALVPQLLLMFVLHPTYIENYCFFMAITGYHEAQEEHHEDHDKGKAGHGEGGEQEHARTISHDSNRDHDHHDGPDLLTEVLQKMKSDAEMASAQRRRINKAIEVRMLQIQGHRPHEGGPQGPGLHCSFLGKMKFKPGLLDGKDGFQLARRQLFLEMDKDKSGAINLGELRWALLRLFANLGHVRLTGKQLKRLFRMMDPDASGTITEVEFETFLGAQDIVWDPAGRKGSAIASEPGGDILQLENARLYRKVAELERRLAHLETPGKGMHPRPAAPMAPFAELSKSKEGKEGDGDDEDHIRLLVSPEV